MKKKILIEEKRKEKCPLYVCSVAKSTMDIVESKEKFTVWLLASSIQEQASYEDCANWPM